LPQRTLRTRSKGNFRNGLTTEREREPNRIAPGKIRF
jgi:hypothetical protein